MSLAKPSIFLCLFHASTKSTQGRGVRDFQFALPQDTIYVYDNNSTDRTASIATKAGAIVRHELFQGKGNVVRRMFSDVEAEIYVLVDGNDTYDAAVAPELIDLCDASST